MKLKGMIAAAAAFVMLAELGIPANAEYYSGRRLRSISPRELVFQPFDSSQLDYYIDCVDEKLGGKLYGMEIPEALSRCCNEYVSALEAYRLSSIENDVSYSAESAETMSEAYSAMLSAFEKLSDVIRRVGGSRFSYMLSDVFGETETEDLIGSLPPENYYELSEREEEQVNQYTAAAGDSDACAAIYIELVKVRNEIAESYGYDSYADYAHEAVYGRDYTRGQLEEFSNAIAENFSGIFEDMFNASMVVRGDPVGMSESGALERIDGVMGKINGELKDSFDYMLDNGLYNVSYSSEKNPVTGAYTVVLPELKVPYMFVNPGAEYERNSADAVRSIIHEFGHFSALLNDPAMADDTIELTGSFSMDTCEVHSQGLESIAESYYGELFGSGASKERYMRLVKCVGAILDGCMFNELQTRVYDAESITVDEINSIMIELLKKYYDLDYNERTAQSLWTSMTHSFEAPMYYISYAVSGAAALSLLLEADTDMVSAVDKYMKISALGGYVPFGEALEKAGFDDIFDENVIAETAEGVKKLYGIGYSDVGSNSWYEPFVLFTSHIFDGADSDEFAPDMNITRNDFLELIANGYDYYSGNADFSGNENEEADDVLSWAEESGIAVGYAPGEFGGEDSITREQLVVMLYRLYQLEGGEASGAPLDGFADSGEVSDWAREAMEWAVENEIIRGRSEDRLEPKGNATRAEAAKIESCYIELMY